MVKVDYAQLFNTSRLETTTLRATLGVPRLQITCTHHLLIAGCVHHGVYDTALLKLRYLHLSAHIPLTVALGILMESGSQSR